MNWLPNVIGFQLVWMASVAGAAHGWWWAGPAMLAFFAAMQLGLSRQRRSDLWLMLICAVIGFVVDSLWVLAGLMQFATPWPWPQLAPAWIISMWVGFALTLNHSLASLKRLPWIAALLGLLGGPLAYFAADRAWHAVALQDGALPYVALGIAWAVLTPLLLRWATRLSTDPSVSAAPQ